jgi:hypothetical protein
MYYQLEPNLQYSDGYSHVQCDFIPPPKQLSDPDEKYMLDMNQHDQYYKFMGITLSYKDVPEVVKNLLHFECLLRFLEPEMFNEYLVYNRVTFYYLQGIKNMIEEKRKNIQYDVKEQTEIKRAVSNYLFNSVEYEIVVLPKYHFGSNPSHHVLSVIQKNVRNEIQRVFIKYQDIQNVVSNLVKSSAIIEKLQPKSVERFFSLLPEGREGGLPPPPPAPHTTAAAATAGKNETTIKN